MLQGAHLNTSQMSSRRGPPLCHGANTPHPRPGVAFNSITAGGPPGAHGEPLGQHRSATKRKIDHHSDNLGGHCRSRAHPVPTQRVSGATVVICSVPMLVRPVHSSSRTARAIQQSVSGLEKAPDHFRARIRPLTLSGGGLGMAPSVPAKGPECSHLRLGSPTTGPLKVLHTGV